MNQQPLKEWKFQNCRNCSWGDCPGKHLLVKIPTGQWWDLDDRAANCANPHDRQHRCWVRWGEVPFITVNKDGKNIVGPYGQPDTCGAGAGSILMQDPMFHGFLRNGVFHEDGVTDEMRGWR